MLMFGILYSHELSDDSVNADCINVEDLRSTWLEKNVLSKSLEILLRRGALVMESLNSKIL